MAGLSLVTAAAAFADDPTSMAPPIETSTPQAAGVNTTAESVFNWQEIPANQQVPLTRATFDQGGYQLYDTVGETVIVPFTNQNLYVMKFAQSTNGTMYFENDGGYPVLYVPKGGYLENATVAGAHWYPFGQEFHPAEPVFLGIAPTWSDYVAMGWYPDMYCYGGYYSRTSFLAGGIFLPSVGLFFEIGGHPYYGWNGYHHYYAGHPDFYHTSYYRRDFYHWAGRPSGSAHEFGGGGRFGGAGHSYYAHRTFGGARDLNGHVGASGHPGFGGYSGFGGVHSFRGTSGSFPSSRAYSVQRPSAGSQGFGGHQSGSGGQTFRGGFGQGSRSYGERQTGGGRSGGGFSGGGHTGGGHSGGGDRSGGGSNRSRR